MLDVERKVDHEILLADGWFYCEMILPQPYYAGYMITHIVTARGQPYAKWGYHTVWPNSVRLTHGPEVNSFNVKEEPLSTLMKGMAEIILRDSVNQTVNSPDKDTQLLITACNTAAVVSRQHGHTDQADTFSELAKALQERLKS